MFDVNDNPYQSPVVSCKGEYDWTLAKRIFVAFAVLAAVYMLPGAIGSYQAFNRLSSYQGHTILQKVGSFLTDWSPKQEPDQS
jgi:hypothetical protein